MTGTRGTHKLADVRVRDPFILPDPETQTYYLCVALRPSEGHPRHGVGVYSSKDLETWHGPATVFETPADFWAQGAIWAPEMHCCQGRYYLFLTFNTGQPLPASAARPEGERPDWPPLVQRSVQVLVADSPLGPFRPFHNHAHTSADVMALDGTLWVEDGVPYMVYCHEWVQTGDGTVDLVRLAPDLSAIEGDPAILFRGSDSPWTYPGRDRYVTDGPFLYRTATGKLLILWSTFGWGGYMTLVAASESGSIRGPWVQQPRALFMQDGGHGMIFHRFDGTPMVVLHHPNRSPDERALLFELEDEGDTVSMVHRLSTEHPFADPDLPIEARIDSLLSLMTLDEKIACLGTVPDVPRLGVWGTGHVEGLHGLAMGGPPGNWGRPSPVPTTTFPQAIGLGETWDPELVRQAAAIEGYETRYMVQSKRFRRGGLVVRAPNADLGRDIRWGRTEECYGEDPYLNGTLVTAFVKGLQGDHPTYWQAASLLKHFLANSNEDERTSSSSNFDQRLYREYYSVPFRMGIMEGGARAYMAAYNAYNGVPCTVHPMLKEITVKEWGQDGIICTDGGAFRLLMTDHKYYPDLEMAAVAVIRSGINQFLDRYREAVEGAVDRGWLAETDLDAVLRGVFRVMIKLGLLDPPDRVPYSEIGTEPELPWESEVHKAFARLITQKSVVLLKNAANLLPLDVDALKTIAVIGPRADQVLLDWYSGDPPYTVTALAGIRDHVGGAVRVTYAADNEDGAAVKLAEAADVAIVCVGNHPTGNAGWAQCPTPSDGKEAVDRRAIVLEQEELIKQVYRVNPNTVVVLISSFPFAITWTQRHVPAIVHLTHNSQELGNALADVLFGDVNPGGRTVQTWPHSIEQLPPRLDYDLRNGRTYMYFRGEPLYPFGYGLSYTTFAYSNLRLSAGHLAPGGALAVSVDVTNSGARAGDEVVQLYVRHLHSTVERPKKELKGFKRITLQPGETQAVTFPLRAAALAYWDADLGGWQVEADRVRVMVGASSADIKLVTDIVVEGGP
jgi:beta-glucosidase